MWNDASNNKKVAVYFTFIFLLIFLFNLRSCNFANISVAYAENGEGETEEQFNEKTKEILDNIDSNELDDFVVDDFNLIFFNDSSFKDLVIKILNGSLFDEYDSLYSAVVDYAKSSFSSILKMFVSLLSIVLLYSLFKNFCSDKFADLKKIIKFVFSLVIVSLLAVILKDFSDNLINSINKLFSFAKILFPILLNLILLSGASGSYSVFGTLSLFLINTGSYVFVYVLLPLAISIMLLSLFGSVFSNGSCLKLVDLFSSIFKYVISIFFGLFGLFSVTNLTLSGMKDGVSLKLTKFAIKNYIPILGGYISEGFDFVRTCSVLIKNAFGVTGIIVLLFLILKPLIIFICSVLMLKVLAIIVLLFGEDYYSNLFTSISKCISYFISVLIGIFLCLIVFIYLLVCSVSVVQ